MANNVKSGMSWMNASLGQKTYSKTKAVDQAKAIQSFNLKTILKGSASDEILNAMFDFEGTQAEQTAQLKKVEELVINLLP